MQQYFIPNRKGALIYAHISDSARLLAPGHHTPPVEKEVQDGPGTLQPLVAGTRSPVRSPDLSAAFREEECTFRPFALPVITDYPIINHYSRKFPISHPHTVTAPKWGLRWVEPPGCRAGKAAGDLALDPARLPRGSRQFQRQFMLVSGRSLPRLKLSEIM